MKDHLHERLADLAQKIDDRMEELKLKQSWHDEHELSVNELKERYTYLENQLNEHVHDLESHDHHVTVLERSVLNWIDGLDA